MRSCNHPSSSLYYDDYDICHCALCEEEKDAKKRQDEHDDSVARQKAKMKIAPWNRGTSHD